MNACIITIGNELLDGTRLDTNSQWISKTISQYEVTIDKIISISDNKITIYNEIKECIDKYNFIFITGGLGPTHDDVTLVAFQEVFSLESRIDLQYLERLHKMFLDRNIEMPEINKNQALVLENTNILDNPIGTARGLHYRYSKSNFFLLPGVPSEMYNMMKKNIIPSYLGNKIDNKCKTIRTSGIAESKLSEKIEKLISIYNKDFNFSFLPSYKGVDFILKSKSTTVDINTVSMEFYNQMVPYAFGFSKDSFPSFIINELSKKDISISLAESCTGGLLGKILTDTSGSSKVFKGGIIAYSNSVKINQLNISKEKLKKYGAVSSEIAEEMALNVKNIFNSTLGLSITGIAGPEGESINKNTGLVYIGISFKDTCFAKEFNFNFNRDLNRKISCYTALNIIKKIINDK